MSKQYYDCGARQHSDQMLCSTCGLAWDTNDPNPPMCPATKHPAARTSSLSADEAHARIAGLTAMLRASPVASARTHKLPTEEPRAASDYVDLQIGHEKVRMLVSDVYKATQPPGRVVVCAAVEFMVESNRVVFLGARHFDAIMRGQMAHCKGSEMTEKAQGFIDQWGTFMSREEALIVAYHAGQLGRRKKNYPLGELFSEDLY